MLSIITSLFSMFLTFAPAERLELSLSYELSLDGDKMKGRAELVVQDHCFRLEANDFTVYNDGRECCTVDKNAKEVIVEDALDVDMSSDPKDVLRVLGMDPSDADVSLRYDANGLWNSLDASLPEGIKISVQVRSVRKTQSSDGAEFSFNRSALDKKWVVTDLR